MESRYLQINNSSQNYPFSWSSFKTLLFLFSVSVGHHLADRFYHGMRHWFEQTCIKFVRKKTGHRDWVELYREKNPLSRR